MKLLNPEEFRKLPNGTVYAMVVDKTVMSQLLIKESTDSGRYLVRMEQDSGYIAEQLKLVRTRQGEGYVPTEDVTMGFVKGGLNSVYAIFSSEELTGMIGFLAAGLTLQLKEEGLTA